MAENTDVCVAQKARSFPKIEVGEDNRITVHVKSAEEVAELLGMKTTVAADGVFLSALEALGVNAKEKAQLIAAMFAEAEPRDGFEAMLVAQMTATHIGMTVAASKMTSASNFTVRESCERSMTRLSRTYLAQMDALKKYRAQAQQVVSVERVTVESGGKAIVGSVTHGGGQGEE